MFGSWFRIGFVVFAVAFAVGCLASLFESNYLSPVSNKGSSLENTASSSLQVEDLESRNEESRERVRELIQVRIDDLERKNKKTIDRLGRMHKCREDEKRNKWKFEPNGNTQYQDLLYRDRCAIYR